MVRARLMNPITTTRQITGMRIMDERVLHSTILIRSDCWRIDLLIRTHVLLRLSRPQSRLGSNCRNVHSNLFTSSSATSVDKHYSAFFFLENNTPTTQCKGHYASNPHDVYLRVRVIPSFYGKTPVMVPIEVIPQTLTTDTWIHTDDSTYYRLLKHAPRT